MALKRGRMLITGPREPNFEDEAFRLERKEYMPPWVYYNHYDYQTYHSISFARRMLRKAKRKTLVFCLRLIFVKPKKQKRFQKEGPYR